MHVVALAMTSTFLSLRITAVAGICNAQTGTGITSCAAYRLNPKDEKLETLLKLKTERSSLEHSYAPKTYLRMFTS